MTQCDRYLGLPMAIGNSKVNTFKDIQEKITKCVMGWKEKFISKAGREILIKTVAQAIPTYSMSLFKLPRSLCDNINSLMAKYWCGQHQDERKIHWINWKKICTQKKNGGMGFRDLHSFNLAMLSKQAWRLTEDTHSLFYKVYKARYFPNGSFMTAEVGSSPSFVWRSLLAARDILVAGSYWRVGDGRTIGVFTHRWLSHTPIPLIAVSHELQVCDLIDEDTRQRDRRKLQAIFIDRTQQEILNIPLTNLHSKDTLIWKENRKQKFSVKTEYRVAMRLSNPNWAEHSMAREHSLVWNKIWSLNVPPKVRTFLWRACSNCLPTRDNLHRRRVSVKRHCGICHHRSETVSHILWECPLA